MSSPKQLACKNIRSIFVPILKVEYVIYDRINQRVINQSIIKYDEADYVYDTVSKNARFMIGHTSKASYSFINNVGEVLTNHWKVEPQECIPSADESYLKLSVQFHKITEASLAKVQLFPRFEIVNWGDSIEISKKFVNKWTGLKTVLDQYQLSPQEVVAFGDGANDIEMIKNVGVGVAMGNARYMVKKVAKHITESHEKDGIADFFLPVCV